MSPSNEKLVHQWWKCSFPFLGRRFMVHYLLGKYRGRRLLTSWLYLTASVPEEEDFNEFIFQKDEAPPFETTWTHNCWWRRVVQMAAKIANLTPYGFFLWGKVFAAPQSRSLTEFKKRNTPATASHSRDTAKSFRRVGLPSRHLPSDSWSTHRVSVRYEKSFARSSVDWCQLKFLSTPHVFCITLKEWSFLWLSYINLFYEYIYVSVKNNCSWCAAIRGHFDLDIQNKT
jgi:hypothetical protein